MYYSNEKEVFLPLARFRVTVMRQRRRVLLQAVVSLSSLSLFCCVVVMYSTMRQIDRDELLRDSEINNNFNGFPWLDDDHGRESNMPPKRIYMFRDLANFGGKEEGRVLQSFPRLRARKRKGGSKASREQSEMTLVLKEHRLLGCKDMKDIQVVGYVGHGYTKLVEKGIYKGVEVAVKSVPTNSEDIKRCVSNPAVNRSIEECFTLSKYKVLKEIVMLQELQHRNIVKLVGFCCQNELNTADLRTRGLTMVTEIGGRLDVIILAQLPWQERLRICVGLARLLTYLAHSPLGSLIIRDFKLTQFILVDGEIKLTDFDDVDNKEPGCSSSKDCVVQTTKGNNKTLPCDRGQCHGFNAAKNLADASRCFIRYILLPGAPEELRSYLTDIKHNLSVLAWDSHTLLGHLERVVNLLVTGKHLARGIFSKTNSYKKISDADFPNMHDYSCPKSRSFDACEIAVYNVAEAMYTCDRDNRCKAFVVTTKTLWSGYTIVYLKNETTRLKPHTDTTVYLRLPT